MGGKGERRRRQIRPCGAFACGRHDEEPLPFKLGYDLRGMNRYNTTREERKNIKRITKAIQKDENAIILKYTWRDKIKQFIDRIGIKKIETARLRDDSEEKIFDNTKYYNFGEDYKPEEHEVENHSHDQAKKERHFTSKGLPKMKDVIKTTKESLVIAGVRTLGYIQGKSKEERNMDAARTRAGFIPKVKVDEQAAYEEVAKKRAEIVEEISPKITKNLEEKE